MPLPHRHHIQGRGQDLCHCRRGYRKCTSFYLPRTVFSETAWANGNDLVGRYFMEHPHGHAGNIVLSDRFSPVDLYRGKIIRAVFVKAVVTLSPKLLAAEGLSNIYFNLGPRENRSEGELSASEILKYARRWELPDDLGTHLGNVIADLDDVAEAVYHRNDRRCRSRW